LVGLFTILVRLQHLAVLAGALAGAALV
jgi:hypothetical protein